MLRDLMGLVVVGAIGCALLAGYATIRIWQQGERDERRPADAIVVLGAAQYDGRPSPVLRARLDHAIALYREGVASIVVMTGGKAEGDWTTEAEAARRYATSHGVPESAILVETEGRTTLESLRAVGAIFRERGFRSAVFVSDRAHMLRVLRIARDQGIVGWGSPTRASPVDREPGRRLNATVHELGALAVYFLTGQTPPSVETDASVGEGG